MAKRVRNLVALAAPLLLIGAPAGHSDTALPAPAVPVGTDAGLVKRGEYLALAADCVACHSAPGGEAYAGGRGMGSPLGTIYSTNITPDAHTGIGRYTLQDFARALRSGIARDGHHLYPSMPYPSYAKVSDTDVAALYAYFMMAVKPVHQPNRRPDIPWPLSMRWPLAIWNWLFVDGRPYTPAAGHNAQWNRGAYLVQGLGHCGACHTPRGWLFQEEALTQAKRIYVSGATLDNWSAADLTGDVATGLGRWSEADLAQFLESGHNTVGAAFGSMIDVINYSTQYLTDTDDQAIAHYLKSLPPAHPRHPQRWNYDAGTARAFDAMQLHTPGSQLYAEYCAGCHQRDGRGEAPYMPTLAGNPIVLDPDAVSLLNITLNGSYPVVVDSNPDTFRMIPFRSVLSDQQVADVVSFIRSSWGNDAAAVTPRQVAALRTRTDAAHVDELNLLRMR